MDTRRTSTGCAVSAGLLALAVGVMSRPAAAAPKIRGCGWLDHDALRRHIELELASLREELRDLEVDFACGGDDVTIGLSSAERGIRVERRVDGVCCEGVEVERELALLTVGLVRAAAPVLAGVEAKPPPDTTVTSLPAPGGASASEDGAAGSATIAPEPSGAEPTGHGAPAPVPLPAPSVVTPSALVPRPVPAFVGYPGSARDQPVAPKTPRHLIGVGARVVFRNLAAPVPTYGATLSYLGSIEPWLGMGPYASATFGQVRRDGGTIDLRVVDVGARVAVRLVHGELWSVRAATLGGLSVVQVEGAAATSDVTARSAVGATGHFGLQLVPAVHGGMFRVMLPIEGGYLFRAPRGLVSDGQPVQADGFWAGTQLMVALEVGET